MTSRSIQQWFDAYAESHRNEINKTIHWLCVPTIFFSVVGLLSLIPFPVSFALPLNWAWLAILAVLLFFINLSWAIAFGMALLSIAFLMLTHAVNQWPNAGPLAVYLSLFSVAWVGQFIGHKIEGKKPSFLMDLKFLLIGPAWLVSLIFVKFKIRY